MTNLAAKTLTDILQQERAALLAGDFDQVAKLATQKLSLLEDFEHSSLEAETLTATRAEIERNQTLYQAAISGITSARARLAALANVRGGLSVYDQRGKVSKVATAPPGIQRKA